jgi:hypothetical protein
MTQNLPKSYSLNEFIKSNNIDIKFLSSSIINEFYYNKDFNYDNFFWKFNDVVGNYFQLLQKSKKELCELRAVGNFTIIRLNEFLSNYNCEIGMFRNYSLANFNSIINEKTCIEDLSEDEKSLSLVMLNCLVKSTPNDEDLGKQIRNIFNTISE